HGFLQQGSEGVPKLVGVEGGDTQPVGKLAADVLGAGDGQTVRGGVFAGGLEADEQGGGVVGSGGEVVVDRGPSFVGDLHGAFAVAFAYHPQALGFPLAAV